MSEANFTKGEWIVLMGSDGYKSRLFVVSEQEHKTVDICQTYNDNMADANLIAASKNMYEALKALVEHFRNSDENYYQSDLCTDAIEALTKAEGKNK